MDSSNDGTLLGAVIGEWDDKFDRQRAEFDEANPAASPPV
jgi:hypothetical protein